MNLHKQFCRLGREHRTIIYKIQAILPQIYETGIYKQYAPDIYTYARKYASLPGNVVMKILNVAKKLEDKPQLLAAIETAGVHKVALVANVATQENEGELANAVSHMSKRAVLQLSKNIRNEQTSQVENTIKIELDEEMQYLFNLLKKKVGKDLSNKETLRKILLDLTKQQKPQKVKKFPGKILTKNNSRHIPVAIKRQLPQKCTFERCTKPYDHIHHINPYSKSKDNSRENLMPLCKEHHEIAHKADQQYQLFFKRFHRLVEH